MRFHPIFALIALVVLSFLFACVPSPTATPPRATPFPTLALPTDTPTLADTPEPSSTLVPIATVPLLPSPTLTPPRISPTRAGLVSTTTTLPQEALPPLLQIFPSITNGPVSLNQTVSIAVVAADDVGLARLELYDENVLYATTPAPAPPPRTFTAVLTWKTDQLGTHHLRVVAYDVAGKASAPAELAFNVLTDNQHPNAQLVAPVGAIDLAVGAPLVVRGVASDDVAVTRVDLFVDNALYTYVSADKRQGGSPWGVALMWVPTDTGIHNLFLRAHDDQDQTGDSAPLLVNAVDAQTPALAVSYERTNVEVDGTLLAHVLALSPNGIARVELWADNGLAALVSSALPDVQNVLDTQLAWQATAPGDHALFIRAYDRAGLNSSTDPQVVHVYPPGTRAPTPTPANVAAAATITPHAPTPTPGVILPAAPTIGLTTTQNRLAVQLPGPLHVQMTAHGSMELDHAELWAFYQGQANPQLLFTDSVKGATDKTLEYDWTPPGAGVAFLFARVVDQLGQTGQSPTLAVYLDPPTAPTATPEFYSLAPNWQATIPTNKFAATFVQYGSALRGTFTNTPLNGPAFAGTIVTGALTKQHITFSVVFGPSASPRTLDFDCTPSTAPVQLACNYQDESGNRGSAIFTPSP
jgi:Bacterial Ig domain